PPTGPEVDVHIVGVGRFPSELSTTPAAPGVTYAGNSFVVLTPAFYRAYGVQIAVAGGVAGGSVRLKRGLADMPAFSEAARRVSPEAFVDPGTDDQLAATKAR